MYLADGSGRDGTFFELCEDVTGAASHLLAEAPVDICVRPRRNLILQPLELPPKLFRQEVGHDADELTDLEEQPLKPRDRPLDEAGVLEMRALPHGLRDAGRAVARLPPDEHVRHHNAKRGPVRDENANRAARRIHWQRAAIGDRISTQGLGRRRRHAGSVPPPEGGARLRPS